jgi:hypothetical protein
MINLIPPGSKKTIKREYLLRTATVWMVLFSIVGIITIVLLVPTYVLLSKSLDVAAVETNAANDDFDARAYEELRSEFKKTHLIAQRLAAASTSTLPSTVFADIQAVQTNDIMMTGFTYEADGTAVKKVEVRGIASTRAALAAFSSTLEQNPRFARAEVPVSSLTNDRDLPFVLTITMAKTPKP